MSRFLLRISKAFSQLFGVVSYRPPLWLTQIVKLHWLMKTLMAAVISVLFVLYTQWHSIFPAPAYYAISSQLDSANFDSDKPEWGDLVVSFHAPEVENVGGNVQSNETLPPPIPSPRQSPKSDSVANLMLLNEKTINQHINIVPHIDGNWHWDNDAQLRFTPNQAWTPGTQYQLSLQPILFKSGVSISDQPYQFISDKFSVNIAEFAWYQDPKALDVRRAISTLTFSHPVEGKDLNQLISMYSLYQKNDSEVASLPYSFNITYNKYQTQAYIQSEPILVGEVSQYIYLDLKKGLTSLFQEEVPHPAMQEKLFLADRYNFLKLLAMNAVIVNDTEGMPQKNLIIEFNDPINTQTLEKHLQIYALPKANQPGGKRYWRQGDIINSSTRKALIKVPFEMNPNTSDSNKLHSLRLPLSNDTAILVSLKGGLPSVNNFKTRVKSEHIVKVPNYPQSIDFMGDGSVISRQSSQTVSVVSRGIGGIKYTIHSIKKEDINHLITQTSGDIRSPEFKSWHFNENNIADKREKIVRLAKQSPQQANYSQLSLRLFAQPRNRGLGLFLVKAQGYDFARKQTIGPTTQRLFLLTDLGVIVKQQDNDKSRVFVQSLSTGSAVDTAKVTLLGKNGNALFKRVTDNRGSVEFPSTKGLNQHQQPTVFLIEHKNDISFIPYNQYSRRLNMSRFDVGGVYLSANAANDIKAMMFTDRGIYRPGETVKLASIIKGNNIDPIGNIPLKLVIRDAGYKVVKEHLFLSDKQSGLNEFEFQTKENSKTGTYSASISFNQKNNQRHLESINFSVEEFQPDTMKINTRLLGAVDRGWTVTQQLTARVNLTNLFDVPAQNRKVQAKLRVKPQPLTFQPFKDYQFSAIQNDPNKPSLLIDKQLPATNTDNNGIAEFNIDLQQFEHGMYQVSVVTEGFEASGGRSVTAVANTLIASNNKLLGFKADGGLEFIRKKSERFLRFIAIDNQLNKTAYQNLSVNLYRLTPLASLVKQPNGTYQYQQTEKREIISTQPYGIPKQGTRYQLDTQASGKYRLEIQNTDGSVIAQIHYQVVANSNMSARPDVNTELSVTLDQSDYVAGDTINLSILSPFIGSGLITIEDSAVRAFKWFKMEGKESLQSITLPDDMEGNGYVNVSFVRSPDSPRIYTNPLVYAAAPFSIDKSKRQVNINLTSPEIARPGSPMSIKYSTDKESHLIIFAIDEGILQVANYQLPDPLNHFLKKRALGVTTTQILDLLQPDFIIQSLRSASGGGAMRMRSAMAESLNPFKRKQQSPAVYWSGIVKGSNTTQQVTFDVPNHFAGQLRVMAIAVSEKAVGATSSTSIVRGPFVLSPNVITHVSPGDTFDMTVNVANLIKGSGENAAVTITAETSNGLTLMSPTETTVTIAENSEQPVSFTFQANSTLGNTDIRLTARYGNEVSQQSTSISVRPSVPRQTFIDVGAAEKQLNINVQKDFYTALADQQLLVSHSPMVLIEGMTHYLQEFPHGCTEQIVSQVFPLVGLAKHPNYKHNIADTKKQIETVLQTLTQRQQFDGGFTFWPSQTISHTSTSIHTTHFIIEARLAGFNVADDLWDNAVKYLSSIATSKGTSLSMLRQRSKVIYLLTRTGMVTSNLLLDLQTDIDASSLEFVNYDILKSYMAASYQLLQAKGLANTLIVDFKHNTANLINEFDSQLSQHTQHLYLLARHFEDRARALPTDAVSTITTSINRGQYNTVSAAFSALALGALDNLKQVQTMNYQFTALNATSNAVTSTIIQSPFDGISYPVETNQLKVQGQQRFYYLNRQSGYPQQAVQQASFNGIEIVKTMTDLDGNPITSATVGSEALITLNLRTTTDSDLKNIAIIDLLPGGSEIIRSSIVRDDYRTNINHFDVRDDRATVYTDLTPALTQFNYRIKFTTAGEFVVPSGYAKSMYQIDQWGQSASSKIKVTP